MQMSKSELYHRCRINRALNQMLVKTTDKDHIFLLLLLLSSFYFKSSKIVILCNKKSDHCSICIANANHKVN